MRFDFSEGEVMAFMGVLLARCLHPTMSVKDVFSSGSKGGLFPSSNFGRFVSRDRFQWFWSNLTIEDSSASIPYDDPWYPIRRFVDKCNENRKLRCEPGGALVVDESMSEWTGKAGKDATSWGGLPHLSFIKRKPKPLGTEFKTTCCGATGVMIFMEIQEGKDADRYHIHTYMYIYIHMYMYTCI